MLLHVLFKMVFHANNIVSPQKTLSPPPPWGLAPNFGNLWSRVIPGFERMKLYIHILKGRVII
jgi:hypothetical protein